MKIKGVQGGKHKGDPIEYTAEEKVQPALKDGLDKYNLFPDHVTFIKEVKIENVQTTQKGELLKKLWANNHYTARGTAVVGRINKKNATPVKDTNIKFDIAFNDSLDVNGLPDLDVVSLVI